MARINKALEFVDPEDDLPCDDPYNPGYSIPVRLLVRNSKGKEVVSDDYARMYYVYCEANGQWYNDYTGGVLCLKVLGWTNVDVECAKVKKRRRL